MEKVVYFPIPPIPFKPHQKGVSMLKTARIFSFAAMSLASLALPHMAHGAQPKCVQQTGKIVTRCDVHNIDDESLKNRWKMGYASLDAHHILFDNIIIIDNSNDNKIYKPILNYSKSQLIYKIEILPNYFQRRLPRLYKAIERLQSNVPKRIRRL